MTAERTTGSSEWDPARGLHPEADALTRRRRRLAARRSGAERTVRRLATLRLVSAVSAVGLLAGSARFPRADTVLELLAAVAGLVFVAAVVAHGKPRRRRDLLEGLLVVVDRELLRVSGRWRELERSGAGLATDRALAEDLSLLGPSSTFHAISRCTTAEGERTLAAWLTAGEPPPDLSSRQECIRALVPRTGLRHRLEAAGRLARRGEAATRRFAVLLAEQPPSIHAGRPWLQPLAIAWCVATWAQALLALVSDVPTAFLPFLFVQAVGLAAMARKLTGEYDALLDHEDTLACWTDAAATIERSRVPAGAWREIRDALSSDGGAVRAITALQRTLASLQLRRGLLHPIVNSMVPWDLVHVRRLARWRERHLRDVPAWLAAIGTAEASCSLAGAARFTSPRAWPVFDAAGPPWKGEDVRHPLLAPDRAVGNDVELDVPGTLLLVTGSNMSGKSTLLRAVGQCTALALAGGAVSARSLTLRPCRLMTSIRVSDALDEGVSLFHAEVKRLKQVLDAVATAESDAAQPAVLFLLDEILRGTNTRERLAASRSVLRHLSGTRSVGLVTTHDLSLVALEGRSAGVRNVHFREHVEGGRMAFDHRLRPGPVTTTNALEVLRMEGIEVDDADVEAPAPPGPPGRTDACGEGSTVDDA